MNKLMRAGALALAMATMVTGCSSGSTDSGEKEVPTNDDGQRILAFDAFEGGNGTEFLEEAAAAFEEANPEVDVQIRFSKEIDQEMQKDNASGKYADLVYYNLGQESGFTETMLKENAVADISDVFEGELADKMLDGILDGTAAQPYGDGKIYLAPIFYTQTGFWYNATLVGEGKQYALPTTWDEFFALGQQAKADGRSLFTYPQSGYFDATIYAMLAQAGGTDFYNKALSYDANTWSSEEGRKVLDTVAQLVSSDNIFADTVSNANTDGGFKINQQAVIDGDALFMPNGSWVVGEMANSTPADFEWGVMGVPKWSADESQAVYTFTEQMWIPSDAENIDLAKEFIKFMYSDTVVDLCLANKTTNAETGEESDAPIVVPVKGAADKLPEGVIKTSFQTGDDVVAVTGTWATTAPIEGLDMKGSVYGVIDSISTGNMTVDEWQSQLEEVWEKCAGALE